MDMALNKIIFELYILIRLIVWVLMCSFIHITERKCSSMAQTESGGETDALSNSTTNTRIETRNQQELFSNGVPSSPIPPTSKMPQMVNSAAIVAAASNNDPHSRIPLNAENGNMKPNSEKTV